MNEIVQPIVAKYGPMVVFLLVLVVADLVAGISAAVKTGNFHWDKVAETYRTTLLPKVGGWFVIAFLTEAVARLTVMPDAVDAVLVAVGGYGFYGLSVANLLASILKSLNEIAAGPTVVVQQ